MRILKLTEDSRRDILESLLKRSPNNYGEFESRVNDIITSERSLMVLILILIILK